jgi:hypothetical protein
VAITLAELPAVLKALRDRAAVSAPPTVMAMADSYQERVSRVTLRRYSHSFGTKTDSPPGQPPAWVLGALARSVTSVPGASSGMVATARVGPHTIYARLQELGGVVRPHGHPFLRFRGLDGEWVYKRSVTVPARPYMRPTLEDMILDGSLTRAAAERFMVVVWG